MISFVGIGGFVLYKVGYSVHDTLQKTQKDLTLSSKRSEKIDIKIDPFTVLLMGTDGRSPTTHNWRPDVLMLAAVNPKTKSIKIISIPRDTYVEIANTNGIKDKINSAAAYAYRKNLNPVQNVRETVENLFHIPIDYYAKVNFQGFSDIVDALGGVDVDVPFPFHYRKIGGEMVYFKKGPAHLNGPEALAYVRMRRDDPEGDKGRNKRQREVIRNLLDQLTDFGIVKKFPQLARAVQNNFEYSFSLSELSSLSRSYQQSRDNITEMKINTNPSRKYIGGIYAFVEILPEDERERISHILQKQIEFVPSDKAISPNKQVLFD